MMGRTEGQEFCRQDQDAIVLENIVQEFTGKRVLDGISLQVERGEIFGLLGPSGAGKTTLIRIMTGLIRQTGGTAVLFDKDAGQLTRNERRRIGIMMEDFGLYERLTCYDNLKLFARIYCLPDTKIYEVLAAVGLRGAEKKAVMHLSKGMRSRLLLARVLLAEPEILFLDEPASGLDPATAEEIHDLILGQKKQGVTVFLTTHNMAEAAKLCDHVALLNEGRIAEQGNPARLCRKYDRLKKLYVHLCDGRDVELPMGAEGADALAEFLRREVVETVHSAEPNLETVFMELTGRSLRE